MLRLRGQRQFNREVKRSAAELEAMGIKGATALGAFAQKSQQLKNFGRKLTMGVTLPLVGAGVVLGKMSMDFSESMNQIQTQAGVSAAGVEEMRKGILAYAKSGQSSVGPKELAEGMYRIASAGLRGAAAMDALTKAEQLATVGRVDMETASTALSAAVKTGIKGTQDYTQAVGLLNATVGAGNMRMQDLTAALGTGILPRAKAAGLSLKDVGASLALMTSQGMPAASAATRFGMSISQLVAPTDKAKEALEELGLQPMELAKMMQSGNFLGALKKLKAQLDGMSKVQQGKVISDIFGGGRSSASITLLLGSLDDLGEKYDQIGGKAGEFNDALESVNEEPGVKLQRALSQLKAWGIELGDQIMPTVVNALSDTAGVISRVADAFGRLPKPVKTGIVGLVAFAAVLGPLAWGLGLVAGSVGKLLIVSVKLAKAIALIKTAVSIFGVGGAVATLVNPVTLIAVAVIALGAGLFIAYKKIEPFRKAVDKTFASLKKDVAPVIADLRVGFKDLAEAFRLTGIEVRHLEAVGQVVKVVLGQMLVFYVGVAGRFLEGFAQQLRGFAQIFRGVIGLVKAILKGDWKAAWSSAKLIMRGALNVMVGQFKSVTAIFRTVIMTLLTPFRSVWSGIRSGFNSVIGFIGSVPGRITSAAAGMFDGIKKAFVDAINFIINAWNSLEFSLPKVDLGKFGSFGGKTIGTPDIDPIGMANGGTVTQSGLSWVGENGPELRYLPKSASVIPLNREVVKEAVGGGGTRIAQLFMDGEKVAEATFDAVDESVALA